MKSLLIVGSAFLLWITTCDAAVAQAQDKIRLGLSSVTAMNTANWVAEEKGLFRKHGIDAELIVTGQGGVPGMGALLAGDIQLLSKLQLEPARLLRDL